MSNYPGRGKLAYLRRPGQERSAWFSEIELSAKFEALFYRLRIVRRAQLRPQGRVHRAGIVRAALLTGRRLGLRSAG